MKKLVILLLSCCGMLTVMQAMDEPKVKAPEKLEIGEFLLELEHLQPAESKLGKPLTPEEEAEFPRVAVVTKMYRSEDWEYRPLGIPPQKIEERFSAVVNKDYDRLKSLLDEEWGGVAVIRPGKVTLLHEAVYVSDNEDIINLILGIVRRDRVYLIDVQDTRNRTALHWAVSAGNAEAVRLLLKYGADKTLKNNEGQTALYRARMLYQRAQDQASPKEQAYKEIVVLLG